MISGLVGTFFLAASVEGYLLIKFPTWLRVPDLPGRACC